MTLYELTSDPTTIHRTADGAWIPVTDLNPDYLLYKQWLEEGNAPDPAPILPIVPNPLSVDDLAAILVAKKILTEDDIPKK